MGSISTISFEKGATQKHALNDNRTSWLPYIIATSHTRHSIRIARMITILLTSCVVMKQKSRYVKRNGISSLKDRDKGVNLSGEMFNNALV